MPSLPSSQCGRHNGSALPTPIDHSPVFVVHRIAATAERKREAGEDRDKDRDGPRKGPQSEVPLGRMSVRGAALERLLIRIYGALMPPESTLRTLASPSPDSHHRIVYEREKSGRGFAFPVSFPREG